MRTRRADGDDRADPVRPAAWVNTPRRNWRLPRGERRSSARAAWIRRRCASSPIALRRGGRTKISNDTCALTGLPGSVTIGTVVPVALVYRPLPWGMPGCIATLRKSTPWPVKSVLDHLVGAGADTSRGEDQIDGGGAVDHLVEPCPELSDVVGDEVHQGRLATRGPDRGAQHRTVALVDLPVLERVARRDQLDPVDSTRRAGARSPRPRRHRARRADRSATTRSPCP